MVEDALKQPGAVLICWQHEDIHLQNADKQPGISQCILTQTGTKGTMDVPETWPTTTDRNARYDLIFVSYRPSGNGPITEFAVIPPVPACRRPTLAAWHLIGQLQLVENRVG
jgi:hypothetical protein